MLFPFEMVVLHLTRSSKCKEKEIEIYRQRLKLRKNANGSLISQESTATSIITNKIECNDNYKHKMKTVSFQM